MGAEMVLLHFLRWIKQNTDTEITILLKASGPLLTEFANLGQLYLWRYGMPLLTISGRVANRVRRKLGKEPQFAPFPKQLKKQQFDLVYLNTADTVPLAPMLKRMYSCPIAAHIHELSYSLQAWFPDALTPDNLAAIDLFIPVSKCVYNNLSARYFVPAEKMMVFNEFIPTGDIKKPGIAAEQVKTSIGAEDCFVVGSAGQGGWRKGTDIFLRVARKVNRVLPVNNILFVWVGYLNADVKAQVEYEIEKFGLQGKVIFTGAQSMPQDYFQVFDLFLLTSREDPFPLVALEAAALEKPIFCFTDSGGIPEVVTEDTGRLFEYGDIDAMARGVLEASRNRAGVQEQGKKAAEMVQRFDVNVIAPRLFDFINR